MSTIYRHQDYAGNFADVHKHWLLNLLLQQLLSLPTPLHYLESHAGAGCYACHPDDRNSCASGIARLWLQTDVPASVEQYLETVIAINPAERLTRYPGSPLLTAQRLRSNDHAVLIEKDRDVFQQLKRHIGDDGRFELRHGDSLSLIPDIISPANHYLLLVDPPFTDRDEYTMIAPWLAEILRHHSNGVTALWYPLSVREHHRELAASLGSNLSAPCIISELMGARQGKNMYGSAMCLINPPQGILPQLEGDAPVLASMLGCRHRVGVIPGKA